MANEARLQISLQIAADNVQYNSLPTSFTATVTGRKGPTPGALTVPVAGVNVDLSQLTVPGLCRLQNQDATNFVTVGIYDEATNRFHPIEEILPGESYVVRLSRELGYEYGTAGTAADRDHLHLRASIAPCVVLVEAFEA